MPQSLIESDTPSIRSCVKCQLYIRLRGSNSVKAPLNYNFIQNSKFGYNEQHFFLGNELQTGSPFDFSHTHTHAYAHSCSIANIK